MAESKAAEERRALEILNRAGSGLAAETDLHKLVQIVTDAGVELSAAEFGAFFYNVLNEQGESYMLYTLSGAPMAAFSKFPMPRNTEVFGRPSAARALSDPTTSPKTRATARTRLAEECRTATSLYVAIWPSRSFRELGKY
jgi:hypothetical protein